MSPAGRNTQERGFQNLARVVRAWADSDGTSASTTDGKTHGLSDREVGQRSAQFNAVETWLDKGRLSLGRRRVLGVSALAAVATVILVLALRGKGGPEQKLSFVVSGGMASSAGTVLPAPSPTRLTFSDGSDVLLNPGARGQVVGTSARGARVRLEEGRARFAVAHRPRTDWSVEAGPFTVIVHGTVFDVAWSGDRGALAVDLIVGAVTIKGPLAGGVVTLKAGQRLTARAATGQTQIDQINAQIDAQISPQISQNDPNTSPHESAGTAVAVPGSTKNLPTSVKAPDLDRARRLRRTAGAAQRAPALAGGGGGQLAGRSTSTDAIVALSANWGSRVASGAFQSVVDDADGAGVERCLALAPVHSLAALADAARYARRTDLARRALLAERRRFPDALGAHDAAFLIGRLAEDARQDPREALSWYDRYLEEGIRGTYTSEALGRKMLALYRLGELADARGTAERYLATFPGGAYTARARRIQAQR